MCDGLEQSLLPVQFLILPADQVVRYRVEVRQGSSVTVGWQRW